MWSTIALGFSDTLITYLIITLALFFIVFYALISERLEELTGPGGLKAKFRKFYKMAGEKVRTQVLQIKDMARIEKGTIGELQEQISNIQEGKPIILLIAVGRANYAKEALQDYVRELRQFHEFRFVVFVDSGKKFVGYMPVGAFDSLLAGPYRNRHFDRPDEGADRFVYLLCQQNTEDIRSYPGVITATLSTETTNIDALHEMESRNLEAMLVINNNTREPKGIAERDQILARMMLTLVRDERQ